MGKSTLLNALIGAKIAAVSDKPQTTRGKILGVLTKNDTQLVFLDTPGYHSPKNKLGEQMIKSVNESVSDVDAILFVTECAETIRNTEKDLLHKVKGQGVPVFLIINKVDAVKKEAVLTTIDMWTKESTFENIIPISAKNRDGVNIIIEELTKLMPEGPYYYDEDEITDQPEKQIVAEIIREKGLRTLFDEIPHGLAVEIERFEEFPDIVEIEAVIYCEKDSHKRIIIGKGGETLKLISQRAREDISEFLDKKVYLRCFVKVKEGWRNSDFYIKNFGLKSN